MAAGGEADETVAGKGDTVAASSSLLNLKQKGTPIADTVLKNLLPLLFRFFAGGNFSVFFRFFDDD